jgi:hypothetical protein
MQLREKDFEMRDKLAVIHGRPATVLFVPGKKAARPRSQVASLPIRGEFKSEVRAVRRRVIVSVWQTHSWKKKIIVVRPGR